MDRFPINPKKEIWQWGPIPGKLYFLSDFIEAIYTFFPKCYKGHYWPRMLGLFNETSTFWTCDLEQIRKTGTKIFQAHMLKQKARVQLRKEYLDAASNLRQFLKAIDKKPLKSLTDDQLYTMGKKFYDLLIGFWVPTIPIELGNYGGEYLLEQILSKNVPTQHVNRVMEILTAPGAMSFYQEEEIALAETKRVTNHQANYFWLQNSYNGTKVLPVSFFERRKKFIPTDAKFKFRQRIKAARQAKLSIQKEYKLSEQIMGISHALSLGIVWQDERKKQIFIYLHYKDLLLKEIARRTKHSYQGMLNLTTTEAVEALKEGMTRVILRRKGYYGFDCSKDAVIELSAKLTKKYWNLYSGTATGSKNQTVQGTVVSKGNKNKVIGKVKIIFDPLAKNDFKPGNILVAPMTSPEYVFLMKRAAAIVTDTGGMTSHAAIVSRELNVPCIVGTKIATKVLKDGDKVEVDASRGVVRRVS